MEFLTDTLTERVDRIVRAGKAPLLSTTPTPSAIQHLVERNEALEVAVLEIAAEVQRLSERDHELELV
jgi:hypothetical protein